MKSNKARIGRPVKSKWQLWTGRPAMKDWEVILAFTLILFLAISGMGLDWQYKVAIPVIGGGTSFLRWLQENFSKIK